MLNEMMPVTMPLNGCDVDSIIAPVQYNSTAKQAYAVGQQFIMDDKLYKVTSAIAQGGTIVVGTNCALAGNITDQLNGIPISLFKIVTLSNTTSGSVAANSALNGIALTTSQNLTGYTPLGIISINGGSIAVVINSTIRESNTSYKMYGRNVTTSAASYNAGTFSITVVYVKTS